MRFPEVYPASALCPGNPDFRGAKANGVCITEQRKARERIKTPSGEW
jgi:hypothetical protein